MAGPVGGGTGALHGGAFAKLGGVAAKRALVDLAFFGAAERHAVMLQLVHRLGGFTRKVFHRVGVTQPVRALDGVVHVPLPVVRAHVRQRRRDTALCCNRVRAGRENLGYTGRAQALFRHTQRCAQTGAACPDNHDVIFVGFIFICCCHYL